MNVQYIGHSTSKFYRYLNDVIIKPTQLLIKEESQLMSLENEELKRNNEELTNRIDKMMQEFDIMTKSQSRICDAFSVDINGVGKLKKNHKKSQKSHKSDKVSNSTQMKNNKLQSYDSVDSGMHEIKLKENDGVLYIKNKELEICKSEISDLTKKLDDIKNQNKMLQAECKVVTKSLKNCRELLFKKQSVKHFNVGINVSLHANEDISSHKIINRSTSPQRSSSPIYLDIFDTPEMASKFKILKPGKIEDSKKKSSLLSRIYSEIPDIKHDNKSLNENNCDYDDHTEPNKHIPRNKLPEDKGVDLSEEIRQGFSTLSDQFNRKYDELNCNFSRHSNVSLPNRTENVIVLDSVRSSTIDLLNISETQKSIINLISKNSEILANLQESKSFVPSNTNGKTSRYFDANSSRNEACQTIIENINNKQLISTDQTASGLNGSLEILEKMNEQNSKIENLVENLSLILNKANEIKVTTTNDINKNQLHADLPFLLNDDVNIYKNSKATEFSNSLTNQDENKRNNDHKTSDSNESFIENNNRGENSEKNKVVIEKPRKNETQNKSEIFTSESLRNEVIVQEIVPNLFEIPKSKSLSKIPKKINNFKHTFISKSVDKLETMYSNDLESSYETLYDPIFSAR